MGMRYQAKTQPPHHWTPEDDRLVRELYPLGKTVELCARLQVSHDNLKNRACRLKVISPKRQLEQRNATLLLEGKIQCNRCGIIRETDDFYVNTYYGRFDHTCRICRCSGSVGSLNARISRLAACKTGPLTAADVHEKWVTQNGLCAYSKVPMVFEAHSPALLTVDRINSAHGYTVENTVLCCYRINMMKHVQSRDEFLEWCKRVAKHS